MKCDYMFRLIISHYPVNSKYIYTPRHTEYKTFSTSHLPNHVIMTLYDTFIYIFVRILQSCGSTMFAHQYNYNNNL